MHNIDYHEQHSIDGLINQFRNDPKRNNHIESPSKRTASGIQNCEGSGSDSDEITSLPGWNGDLPSKMYSGFIEVNQTANVCTHGLFLIFVFEFKYPCTI